MSLLLSSSLSLYSLFLDSLIHSFAFKYHLFADDSQYIYSLGRVTRISETYCVQFWTHNLFPFNFFLDFLILVNGTSFHSTQLLYVEFFSEFLDTVLSTWSLHPNVSWILHVSLSLLLLAEFKPLSLLVWVIIASLCLLVISVCQLNKCLKRKILSFSIC